MGESFAWKVLGPEQSSWTATRGHFYLMASFASRSEIARFFHRLFSVDSGFYTVKATVSNSSV